MSTVVERCSRKSAAFAVRIIALRLPFHAHSARQYGGALLKPQSSELDHRLIPHASGALTPFSQKSTDLVASRLPCPAIWARHLSAEPAVPTAQDNSEERPVSEYWGIAPKRIQRQDGSRWPWNCFRPADTYSADLEVDIERHHPERTSWVDRVAHGMVRVLRMPVDVFFKDRHVSHALLLETVAAVPGMVGGMLLHLRSLRRFEHSGGWIRALLEEAENERMHLMTWVEVLRPAWWERALVLVVQGTFFNVYFLLYLASPRLAHRFVGYLEEEAVRSYSDFLHAIDVGDTPNGPAPLIAIDYWRLPADATIRDVVLVVRADEAHHRDVNHFAADVYNEKRELSKSPAPVGYH